LLTSLILVIDIGVDLATFREYCIDSYWNRKGDIEASLVYMYFRWDCSGFM